MGREGYLAATGLFCAALLIGCQQPETPAPLPPLTSLPTATEPAATLTAVIPGTPASSTDLSATPMPATIALPSGEDAIRSATEALATALGVPASALILVDVPLPVQWNDTSLGCPQPGQAYAQVITPGYLIRLAFGDRVYNVHTDLLGNAVVCFETGDPIGPGTVPDPIVAEFIAQAIRSLAAQLNVPPEVVVLVRSEAVEWSDSSLGCPEPGVSYVQVLVPGYRIVLAVGETRYEYHTDQQRMILCPNPTE